MVKSFGWMGQFGWDPNSDGKKPTTKKPTVCAVGLEVTDRSNRLQGDHSNRTNTQVDALAAECAQNLIGGAPRQQLVQLVG